MRLLTIIFLLLFAFQSYSQMNQTDSNGLRQGLWQKKQDNGRLIYEGYFKDGKPVGEWKRYHPGGQLKANLVYRQNSDSVYTQMFDELKKIVAEGNYIDQKKEGLWIYFSSGRKIAEENYTAEIKNGNSKKYYDTGELMETADWVNGNQQGSYQTYYKNGQAYLQCKMNNNERNGLCLVYTQKGKLEMEAHYKNNLRHGEWKFYDQNGEFHYQLNYNEGEILNPIVRDSIAGLKMKEIEKGKGTVTDPEKFMDDPSEYMNKMKIYR